MTFYFPVKSSFNLIIDETFYFRGRGLIQKLWTKVKFFRYKIKRKLGKTLHFNILNLY